MSPPRLLAVRDLTVELSGRTVLDHVDLDLGAGEVLGVVGESGSGKTLLARSLLGLLPGTARISAGHIVFDDTDLARLDESGLRRMRGRRIGLVLQEPLTSLNPALRIGEQLIEALQFHEGLTKQAATEAAAAALDRVRIADPVAALRRFPHEFSGGQRQRILIASVLILRPSLLIADEPATALDPLVAEEVMDLLLAQVRATRTALVLISHDLAQVARRADRIVVLERGRVVDGGATDDVLLKPRAVGTRRLLEAVPQEPEAAIPREPGPLLLTGQALSLVYPGQRSGWFGRATGQQVLHEVDLELRRGETVGIIGESGSGKSSLALIALGLVEPSSGVLQIEGRGWKDRSAAERRALRRRVRVVFQDPSASLDPRMRISAIVGEGLLGRRLPAAQRDAAVLRALEEVGLGPEHAQRFPDALSGGQRQRVAIARALVGDPDLVVADEPVSALDVTVQAQVLALLRKLKERRGFALLLISHDMGVVQQMADRVLVLRAGRVIEQGMRDEVFKRPRQAYTRALLSIAPRLVPEGEGYRLLPRVFDAATEVGSA